MTWEIKSGNGLYLPQIGWYLDAQKAVPRAYASHAHFDHLGPHQKILCTPRTAALAQTRLSGEREYLTHEFDEPFELDNETTAALYPAGHIVGSSQIRLEREGESLLYTGDFKLTPSISAETCVTPQADILIMETTYGQPRYVFPPSQEVAADIVQFCRDTLTAGDTPIIFGYSLGKSQEVLQYLANADLPIMLHPEPAKLTVTYQALGIDFPTYKVFDLETLPGHVLIAPPLKADAPFMKRIQNKKTAMITGWALNPGSEYRYQCDRLFPLSDHADYLDLVEFVSKVNPQKVYTLHGFADEFAQTLRDQGYDAWPLGKRSQSTLSLNPDHKTNPTPRSQSSEAPAEVAAHAFYAFSQLFTSQELNQQQLLSYFETLTPEESATAAKLLLPNDLFNTNEAKENRELLQKAFTSSRLATESDYRESYDQTRSHPETIFRLSSRQSTHTQAVRALSNIESFIRAYIEAGSPMFRISLLSEEFKKLSPSEAKRLTHILLGNHKSNLDYELLCAALAKRFEQKASQFINAYLKTGDISSVVESAANDALSKIPFTPYHPVPLSRFAPASTPEEIIDTIEGEISIEDLHDGLRLQIHKTEEHVELFDDELQKVTHQFPEIAEALRDIPQDHVAEGRLIPWKDEKALSAALLADRLSRKGEDLFLGEEVPVILWLSDLIYFKGEYIANLPLSERRRHLETFSVNATIRIAPHSAINDPLALDMAFQSALARGSRGILAKSLNSPYLLGQTDPNWRTLTSSR